MPIVHRWRAGKPRPYAGSAPLGNPKIQRLLFNIAKKRHSRVLFTTSTTIFRVKKNLYIYYSTWRLLFNMAMGSGKTLIMAGLILYLYEKGYRKFLFFDNSTNIIEKTIVDPLKWCGITKSIQ